MKKLIENDEAAAVALAALAKMVGLLCAELVVGTHHDNVDLIERCVRAKLHATVEGISAASTAEGVALAHRLVEPVLREVRERAQKMRASQLPQDAAECAPRLMN